MTVEERIATLTKKDNADQLRTQWILYQLIGRAQVLFDNYLTFKLKDSGYLSGIRHLELSGKGLTFINVKGMNNLEILDISQNNIKNIEGLETLARLKVLNAFQNLRLDTREVLLRLQKVNALECLLLGVSAKDHKSYYANPEYRTRYLENIQ